MEFGVTFFLEPLFFTGLLFIILGCIMLRYPPKDINYMYGYRTKRSMKNQVNWDFAQKYSSKLMLKYGVFMCLIQLVLFSIFHSLNSLNKIILSIVFIVFSVILFIWSVEQKLKQREENIN